MKKDPKKLLIFGIIASVIIILISVITIVYALVINKTTSRTIMIYMVGANLETDAGLATADLEAIHHNVKDNNVKVLVIAGGTRYWRNDYISSTETSIYELQSSGFTKVKNQQIQNMGGQDTLTSFLDYAHKTSKTDEYDLIFWNHGGAIDGSEYDELQNDNLSLEEINKALSKSSFKKKKLELIIFRTCLNGTLEVNDTVSDYAKYLVASEEITYGASYTSVLNFINDITNKDNAKIVGKKFINAYKSQINDIRNRASSKESDTIYSTYSLVDLSKIPALRKSVNAFFKDINVSDNFNTISKVRANLYQYANTVPSYDTVDLYNLVSQLKHLSPKKANKVIQNLNNTIVYNFATDAKSRGISIYFPYNGTQEAIKQFVNVYDKLNGFEEYRDFINKFNNIKSSDYKSYSYVSNTVQTKSSSEKTTYADFELELTDEQKETFAKANYIVYKDLKTGYFKPVYRGISATLDGNTLKASIKDRQLQIVAKNKQRYDLTAFESENTEDYIKYTTNVILQSFRGNTKEWKNDSAVMTIYYNKTTAKANIASTIYNNKNKSLPSNVAADINEYDNVVFSISSGWTILDKKGNYIGPITENGKVKGDGIITGFEEKPGDFTFELSNFDENADYYCVFVITDTHNNVSYSKLIKLK